MCDRCEESKRNGTWKPILLRTPDNHEVELDDTKRKKILDEYDAGAATFTREQVGYLFAELEFHMRNTRVVLEGQMVAEKLKDIFEGFQAEALLSAKGIPEC